MGIISSTFASLALQFAWNCRKLLDHRYRSVVDEKAVEYSPISSKEVSTVNEVTQTSSLPRNRTKIKLSLYREKNRRTAKLRYRGRPSSFDDSLITRCPNRPCVRGMAQIVTSNPNPRRQRTLSLELTSSSVCSSDSGSDYASDSDSDNELNLNHTITEASKDGESNPEKVTMSAAEEEAFKITVGRGHFSQSKKERFLNNLRLQKRLSKMNNDYYGAVCQAHCHTLPR